MYKEDFLIFNDKKYILRIFIEKRRSTYMSIGKNVNIRVPIYFSEKRQNEQILSMKNKFIKYLEKDEDRFAPVLYKSYSSGDSICVLNKVYSLNMVYKLKKTASAKLIDSKIHLSLPLNQSKEDQDKQVSILINKILEKDMLFVIKSKVDYYNNLYFKQDLKSVSLKNNSSKFGSCSHDKKLIFSTSLLVAREDIIDYVIVHELAHTIQHNHSKRFWGIVEKIIPDYKKKNKWLRVNRSKLII